MLAGIGGGVAVDAVGRGVTFTFRARARAAAKRGACAQGGVSRRGIEGSGSCSLRGDPTRAEVSSVASPSGDDLVAIRDPPDDVDGGQPASTSDCLPRGIAAVLPSWPLRAFGGAVFVGAVTGETLASRVWHTCPVRVVVRESLPSDCETAFDLVHDYGQRLAWDTLLSAAYLEGGAARAGLEIGRAHV